MEIQLNGETVAVPSGFTLTQLLESLELATKRLAVEVNEQIIPRSQHPTTALSAGDRIEIVHAIGGG